MFSEEALQISEKRSKSKGEKEKYIHVNAEFQRIARRDKKAFLTDQCKKKKKQRKAIESERLEISLRKLENKGTFHANMSIIKDRNCMDQTKVEDIKKRLQQYTEELYKKDLNEPNKCCNHLTKTRHL